MNIKLLFKILLELNTKSYFQISNVWPFLNVILYVHVKTCVKMHLSTKIEQPARKNCFISMQYSQQEFSLQKCKQCYAASLIINLFWYRPHQLGKGIISGALVVWRRGSMKWKRLLYEIHAALSILCGIDDADRVLRLHSQKSGCASKSCCGNAEQSVASNNIAVLIGGEGL